MPEVKVLDKSGKEVKTLTLADEVFGIEPNVQAMYDALRMQMASLRQGTADTKERSEVRGGGKKPYRQKGTGNARRGHSRSPILVGGGVVFGPSPRSYTYHINKKVSRLAVRSLLSEKVQGNDLAVVDNLEFEKISTKEFVKMMDACKFDKKTLFVVGNVENWNNAYFSGRNIPSAMIITADRISPVDLANADTVVLTEAAVQSVEEAYK